MSGLTCGYPEMYEHLMLGVFTSCASFTTVAERAWKEVQLGSSQVPVRTPVWEA